MRSIDKSKLIKLIIFGGTIMESKKTVKNETTIRNDVYVIGPGGVRMSMKEFLEWKESERN